MGAGSSKGGTFALPAHKKITQYYKTHGIKKKGNKKTNGKKELRKVKGVKKPFTPISISD